LTLALFRLSETTLLKFIWGCFSIYERYTYFDHPIWTKKDDFMENPKIGYARVSTLDQNLDLQIAELKKNNCEKIYKEKISGKNDNRPQLKKMLDYIREGDTVVVTKLDRLARSTKDLLNIAEDIENKGADLEVLNINLDTGTPTGKLMLTMLAAIATFEREIMLERQREGIQAAKSQGKYKGRKPVTIERLLNVQELIKEGLSVNKATQEVDIAKGTYYKAIKEGRIGAVK